MKKAICLILVAITLMILPLQVCAFAKAAVEAEFSVLEENISKPTKPRTRKKVEGLRLYVDNENPLFMIRNCPFWRAEPTGYDLAEEAIKTYYALPEDIRSFTVIYIDEGPGNKMPVDQQLKFWDELLTETARYDVPIVVQSECFNSNKSRAPFTQEQLSAVLKKHKNLMGFVQVELSTNGVTNEKRADEIVGVDEGVNNNILNRMKDCANACIENGALFIWQDMEYTYWQKTCYINHLLKDKELYDLFKSNSQNIIIMDKHNGHGRHFSNQANILGCWLDGVCSNWGVNLENFFWYEEGFMDYNDLGVAPNEADPVWTAKYPPSLLGIDLIADLVAGATVYSLEGTFSRGGMYHNVDGEVILTPTFYDVFYPIFQKILNGCAPTKEQVKNEIKIAFEMKSPISYALRGNDAHLLQGLYSDSFSYFQEKFNNTYFTCTKDWVPSTGRYYIIPILPIHSEPEEILPESYILNDFKYWTKGFYFNLIKTKFFNKYYEEAYTGDGVLFDINNYIYVFNSNENKTTDSLQSVSYTLPETKIKMNADFVAHTYAVFNESKGKIEIDLCNLRLDTNDVVKGLESEDQFMRAYAAGEKRSNEENFRESAITLTGFEKEPKVTATGSNGAKLSQSWNEKSSTLTLKIISNGEVRISVK